MKELVYSRLFESAVRLHGDRTYIVDGSYEASYRDHRDRVVRACGALRELGIRPGDRFAVLAPASHRYVELLHAAALGAGVINPLNSRLSAKELEFILGDSETTVAFVDDTYRGLLEPAAEALGLRLVRLDDDGTGKNEYELLLDQAAPEPPVEPEEDDAMVLMYTGGTTGLPKGVLHDHRAEVLNLYHVQFAFPLDERSTMLLNMPMFHVGGVTTALLAASVGARVVVHPTFDAGAVLDSVERHEITHLGGVPTTFSLVLRHPDYRPERLRSVRGILSGGSPMSTALLRELADAMPDAVVMQGYGMTEAGLFVSCLAPHQRDGGERDASVGRPVLGVQVEIRDAATDEPLPTGEVGEICLRGGNFLREYWHQPELTAETLRGGWYHTGDAGYLDADGFLYIKDRVKDMIISGGENVYPAEVENAIASHPAVSLVAVIGIPHPDWDEAVHAIVVPRPGATVTAEEIQAHARQLIAGYKVPKSVEFRDELPLSGPMKPLKRELRKEYWPAPADVAS